MRRRWYIQLDGTDVSVMMPCPMCGGPTDLVEGMSRFRSCSRCAQMVRTKDCGKTAAEAWADQKVTP